MFFSQLGANISPLGIFSGFGWWMLINTIIKLLILLQNQQHFAKSGLIWISTALFFKKYCKNNLILLTSKNMILRFCSSIQTNIKIMFFEISKIKLCLQYFFKINAVTNQISSLLIKFSCFFQIFRHLGFFFELLQQS